MSESRTDFPAGVDYTDEEFDRAFLRTQRSDALFVANRAVMLVLVFWFMARGIVVHDLSPGFLLLPLAVELVALGWIGLLLDRFVIDCERFARTVRPRQVVIWTAVMAIVISIVLAVDSGTFRLARIGPGWRDGWHTVVETGLIWALVVELIWVVVATVPEVRRWRRAGGAFVWTAVFDAALRFAAMLLVGLAGFAALIVFAELGTSWLFEQPRRAAWFVWSFLLCVEVGGLVLGVKIHRDLARKTTKETGVTAAART